MDPEKSAAIRRAEEINRERQARDFRRKQLQEGALQDLYKELKGEAMNLVSHLQRTLSYGNLKVNEDGDSFRFGTERATLRVKLSSDRIGVHRGKDEVPERTYSIYYSMPSPDTHNPEWRASEREKKKYTSAELADELMLELLDEDYSVERAIEG